MNDFASLGQFGAFGAVLVVLVGLIYFGGRYALRTFFKLLLDERKESQELQRRLLDSHLQGQLEAQKVNSEASAALVGLTDVISKMKGNLELEHGRIVSQIQQSETAIKDHIDKSLAARRAEAKKRKETTDNG